MSVVTIRHWNWLQQSITPWLITALALALCTPALFTSWQFDDWAQRELLLRGDLWQALARMFVFLDGDNAHALQRMQTGELAWWTLPNASNAFWRPLSALTHWLDYQFWPHQAWLMHLHSLLWFAAALSVLAQLYQRMLGIGWSANLALLVFAIDDARGYAVAWLANRNALICLLFGVLMLLAHLHWREHGQARWLLASLLCMLLALFAAEAALGALAFVLAYALWLDRGPFRARLLSVLPLLLLVCGWRGVYRALGYGAWGTAYIDPQQEPLRYLLVLLWRAPLLLLGQLAPLPAEAVAFVAWPWRGLFVLAGCVLFGVLLWCAWPLLRCNRQAAFWLTALLLALVPPSSAIPANRLLCWVGVAFAPLLVQMLPLLGKRAQQLLVGLHVILAGLVLPFAAYSPALMGTSVATLRDLRLTHPHSDVVIVSAPSVFSVNSFAAVRHISALDLPASSLFLLPGLASADIERVDAQTLLVHSDGFGLGYDPVFRAEWHALTVSDTITLPQVQIAIEALTTDGRPQSVRFRFAAPLEDTRWQWLIWRNQRLVPFNLPPLHQHARLTGWF